MDSIKKCKRCILNSKIPYVQINDEEECNFCHENRKNQLVNQRFKQFMLNKFITLVEKTKKSIYMMQLFYLVEEKIVRIC